MKRLKNFLEANDYSFQEWASFKTLTTLGVGGKARFLVYVRTIEELESLLDKCEGMSVVFLGSGSNTLARDKLFKGIVIKQVGRLGEIKQINKTSIYAGAGARLADVIKFAFSLNLSGLEELVGIPGTIGGAIYGNAGAFKTSIGDRIVSVDTLKKTFTKEECRFSYRSSVFKTNREIIIGAMLKLETSTAEEIKNKTQEVMSKRKKHTGKTAGSVFKNHITKTGEVISAGKLIDEVGLRGLEFRGFKIKNEHGNIIETVKNNAKSRNMLKLISKCKTKVYNKHNIMLDEEITII
ncbi:MAG: UDP-N-acetylmuramate dehydrogenase [Firmicutes bacterium]|nr:UDP-N-acetylmuramate dehydrogenase [Bacillota bacterium]